MNAEPGLAALRRQGFEIVPAAVGVLESYGGIVIPDPEGRGTLLWIDGVRVALEAWEYWLERYSHWLAISLTPVGFASRDHAMVMMSSQGKFHGGCDDCLWEYGESIEDVLAVALEPYLKSDASG